MNRWWFGRWILVGAATWAAAACGNDSNDGDRCEPGDEGCPCYRNTCNDGLACLSDLCVDPGSGAEGGRSSSGGTGSGNRNGTGNGSDEAGAGGEETALGGGAGGRSPGTGGTDGKGDKGGGQAGAGSSDETPVGRHGALSVSGARLIDASGEPVKLEGMSSMWLNWDGAGYAESKAALEWMRDNWNLRVFRAAMGVDAEGAYLEDPEHAKAQVNRIVQNAIDLGVYVIIDWHDHEALDHIEEAKAFFDEMSARWGSYPNVLYEVFNEPLALDWATELKPYHQTLVNVIRANDPDNVIVLGTPNWDQDVDVAASSPLAGKNLMYALHFYACSHRTRERQKAETAIARGLPLFVTEWGATHADGGLDGEVCEAEARAWHQLLDTHGIGWTAWKLDGCTDSSCMFRDRTAPVDGGWTEEWLNGHAPFVIQQMTNDAPTTGGQGGSGSGGAGGSGGGSGGGTGNTGGSGPKPGFPPDPAGCDLVVSCPSCCETTGVYALDVYFEDMTSEYVTAFEVTETQATAAFTFSESEEIGAIFFRFKEAQDIGSLGLVASTTGGWLEVGLVSGNGADGCLYPVDEDSISSIPSTCWGDGAGPFAGVPVEQIEVRVRPLSSGKATLSVGAVDYGP